MKFFSKKVAAVAAGLALSGASAFAGHVPGFGFGAESFIVNPTVAGEAFGPFTAGAINFSYTAEVDQFGGSGSGVGATASFSETGTVDFGAFLTGVGGTSLGAGDTGLNLSSSTPAGYSLYALFEGTGTVTATSTTGAAEGTFTTFSVTLFVDRDNDTTFGTAPGGPAGNRRVAIDATPADDSSVLVGTLQFGGFHIFGGLANGDFDVIFNVTSFGDLPGFFSTTADGEPLKAGDFNGVNSGFTGVAPPPATFTDGTIVGSGNITFGSVPEPTSLALVGLALVGIGAARRRKA